jgi:hypothetical protein
MAIESTKAQNDNRTVVTPPAVNPGAARSGVLSPGFLLMAGSISLTFRADNNGVDEIDCPSGLGQRTLDARPNGTYDPD